MTWNLEELQKLKTKLKTNISELKTTMTAIEKDCNELKSAWNTSHSKTFFAKIEEFKKSINGGISMYEEILQKIETKCSQLAEIN